MEELKIMKELCPECGSTKISRHVGEIACMKCGFVIDDKIIVIS
jgi:transcription initiation factor TFIIIB Brf1 subunit/transcription initiation factor TFIIB